MSTMPNVTLPPDMPTCIESLATAVNSGMPHTALNALVQEISHAWNRECDQSDTLFDTLEERDQEVKGLKAQVETLTTRESTWRTQAETALRTAERQSALYRNTKVDLDRVSKSLDKVERELEVERKDHKKAKAQVKRSKESADKFKTRCEHLEKGHKELRNDITKLESDKKTLAASLTVSANELAKFKMATVWAENGEALFLLPNQLTVKIEGKKAPRKAYTLIYTDSRGIWRQAAIGSDHKVSFSKFSYDETNTITKRSVDIANKVLLHPSPIAAQIAQRWLYKVNVVQHGSIALEDLDIYNTAEYLQDDGTLDEGNYPS